MYFVLVLLLEAAVVVSSVPTHVCPKGTHLFKARLDLEVCIICDDGKTYMDDHMHTHLECFNCTQVIDRQLEVPVRECNRTHDTLIHCKEGFYRRRARNPRESDRCVKCVECENPTRLCEGFYDTVCCGHPSYEAVLNKDGVYGCKEKPIVCTQGQYYNPRYEQCLPCPPDTYMSEVSHNNTECKLCQNMGNNPSRQLVQACNSTHSAVFECQSGYFKHSPHEAPLSDNDCLPCQTCQFQGSKCSHNYNAVCCDSLGMKVTDSNTGPVCVEDLKNDSLSDVMGGKAGPTPAAAAKFCGEGEFVSTDGSSNNSVTCRPCAEGSFVDDLRHNRTSCTDCSQFNSSKVSASCHAKVYDFMINSSNLHMLQIVSCVSELIVLLVLLCLLYMARQYWTIMAESTHTKENSLITISLKRIFTFIIIISLLAYTLICLFTIVNQLTVAFVVYSTSLATRMILILRCTFRVYRLNRQNGRTNYANSEEENDDLSAITV